jgi:hypothetical protein
MVTKDFGKSLAIEQKRDTETKEFLVCPKPN